MYVRECGCKLDESVGSTKTSHPSGIVSRDEYFFKVKLDLFVCTLMIFPNVGSLFVKNIQNKVSFCFFEINY